MTSNSIIKLSSVVSFINDNKIFSKEENSFESGYAANFKYLPEYGILKGQVHASMKNKLYNVQVNKILLCYYIILLYIHYILLFT